MDPQNCNVRTGKLESVWADTTGKCSLHLFDNGVNVTWEIHKYVVTVNSVTKKATQFIPQDATKNSFIMFPSISKTRFIHLYKT